MLPTRAGAPSASVQHTPLRRRQCPTAPRFVPSFRTGPRMSASHPKHTFCLVDLLELGFDPVANVSSDCTYRQLVNPAVPRLNQTEHAEQQQTDRDQHIPRVTQP